MTATNSVGTGDASSSSNAVTPATIPGATVIGTATAGNAQATVSFNPPASNGGAAITSYTVTATDLATRANGGQTASGSGSPIAVTGLTNGDGYTFAVTATNSVGASPASAASNLVVPTAPFGITSVTPSQIPQGASKADVVIDGGGYDLPLSVTISGGGVTPALVSVTPTAVTIDAKVNSVALTGARNVTVADANGTVTCKGCFTVIAAPTLTSANPAKMAVAASGSVTFIGSGFEAGATVKISGPSTKVTASASSVVVTATTLTTRLFKVPAGTPDGGLHGQDHQPRPQLGHLHHLLQRYRRPHRGLDQPGTVPPKAVRPQSP